MSVVGPMLTGLFFEAFRILPEKPAKVCQVCQGLFKFRQPVFPVPFFGSNHFLLRRLGHFFVVYGGIIGGILAGWIYCRAKKINFWVYFDLVMPSVALAQGFGRIGCLLAGCCYGKETGSPLSVTFTDSSFAPNGVALVPTQIYSSILDFLNYFILLIILKNQKKDGETAAAYLIFYSAGRFVLEFFRGDLARGNVGALSTSQFISIFTFAAGIFMLAFFIQRGQKWDKREK